MTAENNDDEVNDIYSVEASTITSPVAMSEDHRRDFTWWRPTAARLAGLVSPSADGHPRIVTVIRHVTP